MCHDAGKRDRFTAKQDAKRFLRRFDRKATMRVYFCPDCAAWRLTSRRKRSKPSVGGG